MELKSFAESNQIKFGVKKETNLHDAALKNSSTFQSLKYIDQ